MFDKHTHKNIRIYCFVFEHLNTNEHLKNTCVFVVGYYLLLFFVGFETPATGGKPIYITDTTVWETNH